MNEFLNTMTKSNNFTLTENGAITHKSTLNGVMDLFALGGAYRTRTDADCINLFMKAFEEDETLAMKCLFYLRDVRGGQGERRFFRTVMKWLACNYPAAVARNLAQIPEFGRYDDLYILVGTPLEQDMFKFMYHQLALDVQCKTPSLLAKWLKSENTSSQESKALGEATRKAFGMTAKQYRKTLSTLRARIRIVERLMSENRWDEIEFDKIPSKAGLIYRNAFARRDIIKEKYQKFAQDKSTKVNAASLYPHDIAHRAFDWRTQQMSLDAPDRLMLNKYWQSLPNYFGDREENAIAVVDVSGSMMGVPMEAAVSMGAYLADKAKGPFHNHFITFSSDPQLVKFEGVDIVDKFNRCVEASWGMNTNIEAVFKMLLNTAMSSKAAAEDIPKRIYIFSDMEFDGCVTCGAARKDSWSFSDNGPRLRSQREICTLMESIAKEWAMYGYELPQVIFWNLNARHDNIPAMGERFSYVSGFSPVMMEAVLSGKTGWDLVLEKLNSKRYEVIS